MNEPDQPGSHVPTQAGEVALRDQQAATYDRWILENKGAFFDALDRAAALRWLRIDPSHRVLDAGCGTGRFTVAIAPRCKEVRAVDFSRKSLEVLEQKAAALGLHNITTMAADLTQAELPRDYFHRAISIAVIQHIPSPEARRKAVQIICSSLQPGGLALFMVYRWGGAITFEKESWSDSKEGRLFRMGFTADEIQELLSEGGFRKVRVGGINNFRPVGLGRLQFLLKPYVALDVALSRLRVSGRHGRHLFALGAK